MNNQNSLNHYKLYTSSYDILKQLYLDLTDEKNGIQNEININNDHMKEIDCYLKTILENDDADIKVFSPRNTESLYKDKIYDNQNNRTVFENENKYLYKRMNVILNRIDKLKTVLDTITEDNNYPLDYKSIKINILDIQEKERQRIARDLHDTTVQNLTHLIHKIELSSKFMDQDILRAKLELATLNKSVKEIIHEMRSTIFNLRPMSFDDMGINVVLERFQEMLVEKSEMEIVFSIDEIKSQDDLFLVTIFRSIQECCWNSIQHSKGTKLSIVLKYNTDNVEIIIRDDGIGFEYYEQDNNNHFGLSILKERIFLLSGKIEISKGNPNGTSIVIIIPHTEGKIYD